MVRFARWVVLGLAAFLAAGCATPVHLYSGEPRPPSELSAIRAVPDTGDSIVITQVDGRLATPKINPLFGQQLVYVLPGTHKVSVYWLGTYHTERMHASPTYQIQTKAGAEYHVRAHAKGKTVTIWIEDDNGNVISHRVK